MLIELKYPAALTIKDGSYTHDPSSDIEFYSNGQSIELSWSGLAFWGEGPITQGTVCLEVLGTSFKREFTIPYRPDEVDQYLTFTYPTPFLEKGFYKARVSFKNNARHSAPLNIKYEHTLSLIGLGSTLVYRPVTGTVLDTSGQPIPNAVLVLDGISETTSDPDGLFIFKHVPSEGFTTLKVYVEGFQGLTQSIDLKSLTNLFLTLNRYTLQGHVNSSDGLPIHKCKVSLDGLVALTNKEGFYSFIEVSHGGHVLNLEDEGHRSTQVVLDVSANAVKDFTLETYTLGVSILNTYTGQPVRNSSVFINNKQSITTTDYQGKASLTRYNPSKIANLNISKKGYHEHSQVVLPQTGSLDIQQKPKRDLVLESAVLLGSKTGDIAQGITFKVSEPCLFLGCVLKSLHLTYEGDPKQSLEGILFTLWDSTGVSLTSNVGVLHSDMCSVLSSSPQPLKPEEVYTLAVWSGDKHQTLMSYFLPDIHGLAPYSFDTFELLAGVQSVPSSKEFIKPTLHSSSVPAISPHLQLVS